MSDNFLVRKTKVRVIGIGGGGGSIVSELAKKIKKASFFAANTDSQALKKTPKKVHKLQIGKEITQGLGTGMDPEIGKAAAESDKSKIERILERPDFCIFVACLGGGTGSGATPVFTRISNNLNTGINLGIFTLPFDFEGDKRKRIAKKSLKELESNLNGVLLIHNQKIFNIIDKKTPLDKAFEEVNKVLARDLEGLIDLIYKPGLINIDFADFKTVLSGKKKKIYFSTAVAKGPERSRQVSKEVLSSPLIDFDFENSDRFLFNIATSSSLKMKETEEICNSFSSLNKTAKVVFGVEQNQSLNKSEIEVTLLIAGKKEKEEKGSENVFPKKEEEKEERKVKIKKKKTSKKKKKRKTENVEKEKKKKKRRKKTFTKKEPVEVKVKVKKKKEKNDDGKKKGNKNKKKKKRKDREKKRLNALEIKEAVQEKERKRLAKEDKWDIPAFLRRSPWKDKINKNNN
jgi:cell division protein FtsZ